MKSIVLLFKPYFLNKSSDVITAKFLLPHVDLSSTFTLITYDKKDLHLFFSKKSIKSDVNASVGVNGTLHIYPPSFDNHPPLRY